MPTQLEVQGVVVGVIHALVAFANHAAEGGAFGGAVGIHDGLHVVADTEVGAVHVASNDEDDGDRQVVVGHIRQPEGLCLGMEATQEGENRRPGPVTGAKHMVCGVGVLGVDAPLAGEEGLQTGGVGAHRQEVIPPHMLPPRFGNGHVDQVTGPGQGANPEQTRQVVVQSGFRILKPGQAGAELGLQVQPTGKQESR